jgi:hypothetical protein
MNRSINNRKLLGDGILYGFHHSRGLGDPDESSLKIAPRECASTTALTYNSSTARNPLVLQGVVTMSENTTATETQELTTEQKTELYNSLPEELRKALDDFNREVNEHNVKVESIKAADSKDPVLIKAEIYEQNTANNKKLARIREQELKLLEQVENLRKQAYEIIDTDGLMPKELSESEVQKLKDETAESLKALKLKAETYKGMEEMLPMYKGKLLIHLNEIKTRRGTGGTKSTASGEGPKRPRFKKIEINGVTEDDKGNTVYQTVDGEPKYTLTFASQYLKKQHKGIKWTAKELQDAYFAGQDADNMPEVHTFEMPYTFKDGSGNEHTVVYSIKAYR